METGDGGTRTANKSGVDRTDLVFTVYRTGIARALCFALGKISYCVLHFDTVNKM